MLILCCPEVISYFMIRMEAVTAKLFIINDKLYYAKNVSILTA